MWDDSDDDNDGAEEVPVDSTSGVITRLLRAIVIFLLMWQFQFGISEAGMTALVLFLHNLFKLIGNTFHNLDLTRIAAAFPITFRGLCKVIGLDQIPIKTYVVCSDCHTLYDYKWCIERRSNGVYYSKRCEFVRYPQHPHRSKRKACGAVLMKTVQTQSGKILLKPKKLYCYRPLVDSLQQLLHVPGFAQKCELWRERALQTDVLLDVYDGQIWKEYEKIGGQPFLSLPYNYVVSMNVDWFKPFLQTTYSLGAIYLVLLNLPREERYKVENILLVGLIPGPREPPLVINSYLYPLVEELKGFQRGVKMQLSSPAANTHTVFVKVALGPVICDIPASRKTCGFTGHSAILGCCKCLKQFETDGDKLDYSGFDTENWQPRSVGDHRIHANEHRLASCRAEEKRVERTYGCRYSILLQLTYFDIVRWQSLITGLDYWTGLLDWTTGLITRMRRTYFCMK